MKGERSFNLYTPSGYIGTYTLQELRRLVVSGHIPKVATCGEVRTGWWTRQLMPVPIASLPEVADVSEHLVEEIDQSILRTLQLTTQNKQTIETQRIRGYVLLYFVTWAVVLIPAGVAIPVVGIFVFPLGLAMCLGEVGVRLPEVAYVFYLGHAIFTFASFKAKKFIIMYIILIVALIANIAGCMTINSIH